MGAFAFGIPGDHIWLDVEIPVWRCQECHMTWVDSRSDQYFWEAPVRLYSRCWTFVPDPDRPRSSSCELG